MINAPDDLDFTLPDGIQRTFRIVNGNDVQFTRQGVNYIIYDAGAPATFTTQLTFTQVLPTVIDIELILGRRNAGRWYYASLYTQVTLRN